MQHFRRLWCFAAAAFCQATLTCVAAELECAASGERDDASLLQRPGRSTAALKQPSWRPEDCGKGPITPDPTVTKPAMLQVLNGWLAQPCSFPWMISSAHASEEWKKCTKPSTGPFQYSLVENITVYEDKELTIKAGSKFLEQNPKLINPLPPFELILVKAGVYDKYLTFVAGTPSEGSLLLEEVSLGYDQNGSVSGKWYISTKELSMVNRNGKYYDPCRAWDHYCGGALIHPEWVATAAHCISEVFAPLDACKEGIDPTHKNGTDPSKCVDPTDGSWDVPGDGWVRAGSESLFDLVGKKIKIEKVFWHPKGCPTIDRPKGTSRACQWTKAWADYDVALYKLSEPVDMKDKCIDVVCFPEKGVDPQPKTPAMLSGFGWLGADASRDSPSHLRAGNFETTTREDCQEGQPDQGQGQPLVHITDRMVCAYGQNTASGLPNEACSHDSGSPLIYVNRSRHVLVGTVSGGPSCDRTFLSNEAGYYGDWANPDVQDWVDNTIGQFMS